jgi:hypothetical protein
MMRLLRLALQVVLFFLLLSLGVAVASVQTGTVEKVALIAAGALLVWLASRVRRIGAPVHRAYPAVDDGCRGHCRSRPDCARPTRARSRPPRTKLSSTTRPAAARALHRHAPQLLRLEPGLRNARIRAAWCRRRQEAASMHRGRAGGAERE